MTLHSMNQSPRPQGDQSRRQPQGQGREPNRDHALHLWKSRRIDAWRLMAAACALVVAVGMWAEPMASTVGSLLGPGRLGDLLAGGRATEGFHARMLSEPSGATVLIQGLERGTTPFLGNIACDDGEGISIEMTKQGFQTWVRNPICREGKTMDVTVKLKKIPSR